MTTEERNKIIGECIDIVNSLTRDNCDGACVSCGRMDNPTVIDPDELLNALKKLILMKEIVLRK